METKDAARAGCGGLLADALMNGSRLEMMCLFSSLSIDIMSLESVSRRDGVSSSSDDIDRAEAAKDVQN